MERRQLLSRWCDLESGRGLETAKSVSKRLSLSALAILVLTAVIGLFTSPFGLVFAIPGILVGYLIAERNALDARAEQWPVFRHYIDWPKVQRDLEVESA